MMSSLCGMPRVDAVVTLCVGDASPRSFSCRAPLPSLTASTGSSPLAVASTGLHPHPAPHRATQQTTVYRANWTLLVLLQLYHHPHTHTHTSSTRPRHHPSHSSSGLLPAHGCTQWPAAAPALVPLSGCFPRSHCSPLGRHEHTPSTFFHEDATPMRRLRASKLEPSPPPLDHLQTVLPLFHALFADATQPAYGAPLAPFHPSLLVRRRRRRRPATASHSHTPPTPPLSPCCA